MATTADQLATALRNAHAAGDTAAATKLAGALKAMRQNRFAKYAEPASGTSQLPPGFTLDQVPQAGGLPPGFILDARPDLSQAAETRTYLITAPDGRKFNVTGPGSAEEALAHLQQSVGGGPDFSQAAETPNDPAVMAAAQNQRTGPDFAKAAPVADDPAVQASYARANPPDLAMADVADGAVQNFLPSAGRFAGDIAGAVMHPIETGKNVFNVARGTVEKLIPGEQSHEPYANAVGKFFMDRYGGFENVKRTMAEDPVGFLADLSMVLTGGSTAVARLPGAAGTVSRAVGTVGKVIDPINATLKAGKLAATGAGKVAATASGLMTGTGGKAIGMAATTGFEGGATGKVFRDNMRGHVPMEDVIAQAKTGLDTIKQQRQAAYRAGMADLSKDQTILDFNAIDKAMMAAPTVKVFQGKNSGIAVSLDPSVAKTAKEISDVLDDWRALPADDFHTPEGLDALKQRIGDIRNGVTPGSASEKVVTQVYNVVKDQIVKQAPTYARTMSDYQKASELIREIEGTLSLGHKARIDTQLRKLQSVMRNNAFTNYGKRVDLVKLLEDNGAKNILAALAGQAVNTLEPRGLARILASLGTVGTAGAAVLAPKVAIPLAAGLAASSPRIAGEVAHAGGRVARQVSKVPIRGPLRAAYQTERDLEKSTLKTN